MCTRTVGGDLHCATLLCGVSRHLNVLHGHVYTDVVMYTSVTRVCVHELREETHAVHAHTQSVYINKSIRI